MCFVDVDLQLQQSVKSMVPILENWEHDILLDGALGRRPPLRATRNVKLTKLLLVELIDDDRFLFALA
jgi:hypothetical protein